MRKLILRCGLAPGDIVMLTAAVRDMHRCYPNRFLTDVRTFSNDIWEQNPYITALSDEDPEAEQIDCSYPLINECNRLPHHCLEGFVEFLNQRLDLKIRLTALNGDIHLSEQEKLWYSQVHEVTRQDTPFWIVDAGGKYDATVKWWLHERYQAVIDHFRDRILFVQVGAFGHHHPKLEGTIDLRGRTSLRELIRLVYHSDGVLCPITSLMHLAAAVENKCRQTATRPCVVVAGGREPAHWESYPGHQFIHTIGALDCCQSGGCWKDRVFPLRDGDKRDRPGCRCVSVVGAYPRCMDMISVREVVRRIEWYYEGGALRPLNAQGRRAAARGIAATSRNGFDREPLNLHNAGTGCDGFIPTIPAYPGGFDGRGIVICGGGIRYFTAAWVCIRMLRHLGCRLPIELWHRDEKEMDARMRALVAPFGVECINAREVRRGYPVRIRHRWALKPYAILRSRFREVLFLDADNVPVVNPEFLFAGHQFRELGAIFWPDYGQCRNKKTVPIWRSCGLRRPREQEFETGQILADKQKCWKALCLSLWFNENSDFYYQYLHGDKETFHLAFRKLGQPYALVPTPIRTLERTMCQHDFEGRRLFQHRNRDKWDYLMCNRKIKGFWFEEECRGYLKELQELWDGGFGRLENRKAVKSKRVLRSAPKVQAVMISCRERDKLRRRTLANLARTDWGELPLCVQMDEGEGENHKERQTRCALLGLKSVLGRADYILFMEDDLEFNRHIRHNLYRWRPFRERTATLGSLYNPGLRELACDRRNRTRIMQPGVVFGSQAFLIRNDALEYILANWAHVEGMQDIKISRLAGRLGAHVLYHAPSLVQHVGKISTSEGYCHQAADFDLDWKAD